MTAAGPMHAVDDGVLIDNETYGSPLAFAVRSAPPRLHAIPDEPPAWERVAQRTLDLVVATIAVLLLLVPALLIALAVKLTSDGPVFFRQSRVGRGGHEFRIVKFRTMLDGTHAQVVGDADQLRTYRENNFKLAPDDPRITPVGRFLRSTSLDEVPQLLNVLLGQMSIVGVRPLLAEEVALRPDYDQLLYRRHRPGMTGLWQVEGRSSVKDVERLGLDRRYLQCWSLSTNGRILLRTPAAVLTRANAH